MQLRAGADGKLDAEFPDAEHDTEIHMLCLNDQVTDESQDVGIAFLCLYQTEMMFLVITIIFQSLSCNPHLIQCQIRISKA